MHTIIGRQDGIKVNDQNGTYFKTFKGLRQCDSLSPLLFDLVVDALVIIPDRAKREGFIKGVLVESIDGGVNMLQYANDMIFLLQDNESVL